MNDLNNNGNGSLVNVQNNLLININDNKKSIAQLDQEAMQRIEDTLLEVRLQALIKRKLK
jgi:hypothetical protein